MLQENHTPTPSRIDAIEWEAPIVADYDDALPIDFCDAIDWDN